MGNKRLKVLVSTFLDEYSKTSSRIEKSITVSKIIDMVRDACPVGAFIKHERGVWWEVSDHVARERVGAMFRDSLHEQYKSSSKAKRARRKTSKSSSEDNGDETAVVKQSKTQQEASVVTSSGEGSVHSYNEKEQKKIFSHHQGSARTFIVHHPCLDDDASARIDATDVLRRRLPQHSAELQMFLKAKTEMTCHSPDDVDNPKGRSDFRLGRGSTWPGATPTSTFPDDPFQVLDLQQQLLERQLHQNRQRQWEQQYMYHQQQQRQQLLQLQQQQHSYSAGPSSWYGQNIIPQNIMPMEMNFQQQGLLQDPSLHTYQIGVADPTLPTPIESFDAVALATERIDNDKHSNNSYKASPAWSSNLDDSFKPK
jgi:hypothetical protein